MLSRCDTTDLRGEIGNRTIAAQSARMRTLTWLLAFGLTAAAGRVVNFDNGPLGKTPSDWTVAMTNHGHAPQWEIVKDMSAATPPYVLAQVSADPARDRYPLAVF